LSTGLGSFMSAWSILSKICGNRRERAIESEQGSTDNFAKQVGHITKDADALASHQRVLNAPQIRFAPTSRLHMAVLTSSMSLMRSWADCFLFRAPGDSVRSRVLLREEDATDSGGAFSEDVGARPAIVHIYLKKVSSICGRCGVNAG
jgi:hypothetical protein